MNRPIPPTSCPDCKEKRTVIAVYDEGLYDANGDALVALGFDCDHSTMIYRTDLEELTA